VQVDVPPPLRIYECDVSYLEISGVRKWGKGIARYEAGSCFVTGEVNEKYQS
jgi:hypothetical protein